MKNELIQLVRDVERTIRRLQASGDPNFFDLGELKQARRMRRRLRAILRGDRR